MSERLSAQQVIHPVFLDKYSDVSDASGRDNSDDGAVRVYAYSEQHFDPAEVLPSLE